MNENQIQTTARADLHSPKTGKNKLTQLCRPQVRSGERRRASESELAKLEEKLLRMEAEQEAVLTSMGEELDAACHSLATNGEDKLQVIRLLSHRT